MKQSVDLMNSMKLMNSRHSNTTTTTTSLARRALLLLTLLVMSVGSAWGQTYHNYSEVLSDPSTAPKSFNVNWSTIYSDLGLSDWSSLNTNGYIGWYILDKENNLVSSTFQCASNNTWYVFNSDGTNSSNTFTGATYVNWASSTAPNDYQKNFSDGGNQTNIGGVTITPGQNWQGLTVYAVISNTQGSYTGNPRSIPSKQVVYTWTYKAPDTFKGSLKGSGQALTGGAVVGQPDVLSDVSTTSATLDLSAALAEVSGAKYARIYLVKDGAAVDPTGKLSVTGGTAGPELEHGFYISKPAGLTASDLGGVTLSLTAGEFEDYQVMCVFSTDEATTLPTKEPDWDLQYTYAFEYPFKGDATSATKVEKTFKLPASQWTTSPKEFSIDFDFTNSKILLKDQDNSATLASVDFDKTWWDTNYSGSSVSGKNFYIRWFLKNKSTGVETYIANAIRNVNGATTTKDCAKARYGRFWSTKIGDGETNLNNIMRIKIDGTPDSPGTEFDVRDYDLVCTIGTDGSETLDGSNQVTMEPTTLQMQYTLHFADAPFEAENLSTVKTIYKAALYDKVTGNITPSLFANYQEYY